MQCIPESVEIITSPASEESTSVEKILKSGERSNREIDCCLTRSFYNVVKPANVFCRYRGESAVTELIFSGNSREVSALRQLRDLWQLVVLSIINVFNIDI